MTAGTVVVAEAGPGGGFEVSAVAIDDTAIYWADYLGDRIMRSSIDGGQAQVVASSERPARLRWWWTLRTSPTG